MSRKTQQVTSWIALGAMLFWSFGFCCCITGSSCCSSSTTAQATEGHGAGGCCSHDDASPPEESSEPVKTQLCGCDSHTKNATLVIVQLDVAIVEQGSLLPELEFSSPILSALQKHFLPHFSPPPRQRGPPDATGLS